MLLAGVPLGGLFDSYWDVVVSFFCFSPHPPLLGNKHICASSSIYYYISILHYPNLTTAPSDTHFSLDYRSPRPSHASPSCQRHDPTS